MSQVASTGRLPATKNGKELFFDRGVVIKFAESRGIRIAESGLPQDTNFTNMQQAAEYLQRMIIPGMTITIVKPQEQPTA